MEYLSNKNMHKTILYTFLVQIMVIHSEFLLNLVSAHVYCTTNLYTTSHLKTNIYSTNH